MNELGCRRKVTIAGGALIGITVVVMGILMLLQVGELSGYSPAAGWALVIVGAVITGGLLRDLILKLREKGLFIKEMEECLKNPIRKTEFEEDANKIFAYKAALHEHASYLLIGEKHGLINLGNKVGCLVFDGGEARSPSVVLFIDEKAQQDWMRSRQWLKPYFWRQLPNLKD